MSAEVDVRMAGAILDGLLAPVRQSLLEPEHQTTAPESLVYFVQAGIGGCIKIGSARDVRARVATLQTGCPAHLFLLGVEPGGLGRERNLHRRFAADRARGEWFFPTESLKLHIEALARVLA